MTDDEAAFVEAMGRFLGTSGMTPMAGRMWGWLLVCDPPEQTAADLADALRASRGAISGTARLLETAGFIRRTTRRGDRREFFSAPPDALRALIAGSGATYRRFRQVAQQGLDATAGRPASGRVRIQEVYDFATYVEREIPLLVEEFMRRRAADAQASAAPQTSTTGQSSAVAQGIDEVPV